MEFNPSLKPAKLIKRYKRFLADVEMEDGSTMTIHCPNTGSMKACNMPGSTIWYSNAQNIKRKYPCTWEIIENDQKHRIGVNTHRANKLVAEAIANNVIPQLKGYDSCQSEVKYGAHNSRVDFLLSKNQEKCYVEVKNVTLADNEIAFFPDAITTRGTKHLKELALMVEQGHRAVLFFCVQHTGVEVVKPAADIDLVYTQTLAEVIEQGVEVLCYKAKVSPEAIVLTTQIPFLIN